MLMKIQEIAVKSVMTKSNLPVSDFSVNPYVGCTHACKYCYASFMKRFTNHPEPWGEFIDVKMWPPMSAAWSTKASLQLLQSKRNRHIVHPRNGWFLPIRNTMT